MQRYFLNDSTATIDLNTKIITITGDDAHHMANVMRMKTGDKVYTCYNSLTFISSGSFLNSNSIYFSFSFCLLLFILLSI